GGRCTRSSPSLTESGGLGGGLALGALQDLAHRVRRLGADLEPVIEPHLVEAELRRSAPGIVDPELLDVAAVARAARICDDDTVERRLLGALPRQANLHGHGIVLLRIPKKATKSTGTPGPCQPRESVRGLCHKMPVLRSLVVLALALAIVPVGTAGSASGT